MIKLQRGHLWISESCVLARSSTFSFWFEIEDPCEYPYFEGAVTSPPQTGKGDFGVAEGTTEESVSPLFHIQSLWRVVAACVFFCWKILREDEDVVSSCVDSFLLWSLGFCVMLPLLLDESSNIGWWWGCEDCGQGAFVVWLEWKRCVMSLCCSSLLLLNSRGSEMSSWFWPLSFVLWQNTHTHTNINAHSDLKDYVFLYYNNWLWLT